MQARDEIPPAPQKQLPPKLTAPGQSPIIGAPGEHGMSQTIDEHLVRHIGKLSRIELSDEQVQTFCRQLADILEYFGKLAQLDTEGVEPMAHAAELDNVLAEDVPAKGLTPGQALANAPDRDGDFFKVPKVIGDSQ